MIQEVKEGFSDKSQKSMKKTKKITAIVMAGIILAAGSHIEAADASAMERGYMFFAPDAPEIQHDQISTDPYINGTEIFTTWGTIERQEGVYDWNYIDDYISKYKKEGKKCVIRIVAANFSINDTPEYVYNKYHVRRIAKGEWLNFENGTKQYQILGGEITTDADKVVAGAHSLYASGSTPLIQTDPSQNLIAPEGYSIQFDYRVSKTTEFEVSLTYSENFEPTVKKQTYQVSGSGTISYEFDPEKSYEDLTIGITMNNGAGSIDNLNIIAKKSGYHVGTLCFPNYFDPDFKVCYEKFLKAFANRYNNHPDVAAISVGGYGRWDEITLCDDTDLTALEDQWVTYGYSDQKYIEHIKWCIDSYQKYFDKKELIMCAIGYPGADTFKDQNLIDWTITGYLAQNGVGIKYNGWQSMCSEWGSSANAIFYQINRYKHSNSRIIFETGAQVNNYGCEVMGHPINVMNRAIIDQVDNYWFYYDDIIDPFSYQYAYYGNQSAGAGNITRLYTIMNKEVYATYSNKGTYELYNINQGLFMQNLKPDISTMAYKLRPDVDYELIGGEWFAVTNDKQSVLTYSIDDRVLYSGMYGACLTIDYLDRGTDSFQVYMQTGQSKKLIAEIKKTGTGKIKSFTYYDRENLLDKVSMTGVDIPNEIEINDKKDGKEYIRALQIDFVPARDYKEILVSQKSTDFSHSVSLDKPQSISISTKRPLSGIALPVGGAADQYNNILITVSAKTGAGYQTVAQREYFMPAEQEWAYVPLGDHVTATEYRVELKSLGGNIVWFTDGNGAPAYRVFEFAASEKETAVSNDVFTADTPFYHIQIPNSADRDIVFRKISSQSEFDIIYKQTNSNGTIDLFFEPQAPGRYRLDGIGDADIELSCLSPVQASNAPTRNLLGISITAYTELAEKGLWKVSAGADAAQTKDHFVNITIDTKQPYLYTTVPLNLQAEKRHNLRFVMKNATPSNFVKIYWKSSEDKDFSEGKSMLCPVLPNDDQYREYSAFLGIDDAWQGNITALKIMPVTGHTDSGYVSFRTIELRNGFDFQMGYQQKLDAGGLTESNGFVKNSLPVMDNTGTNENHTTGSGSASDVVSGLPSATYSDAAEVPDSDIDSNLLSNGDRESVASIPIYVWVVLSICLAALIAVGVYFIIRQYRIKHDNNDQE